jgi:phosphate transport system substrate-binding protein
MTAGSIVLAYNLPGLDGDLRLSREAYSKLFLGEITKWNDPILVADNADIELPDLKIALVARQDSSGTTYAFTNHLSTINKDWKSKIGAVKRLRWPTGTMLAHGNGGVAGLIYRSEGSIGYVQFGYAERAGMRMALLQNKAGSFVRPTDGSGVETLKKVNPQTPWPEFPDPDGDSSYPIVTMTWILLYKQYDSSEQARGIRELFQWCLEEDQQDFSTQMGYIPLAPGLVAEAKKRLAEIGP